jgi:hypothetical protein
MGSRMTRILRRFGGDQSIRGSGDRETRRKTQDARLRMQDHRLTTNLACKMGDLVEIFFIFLAGQNAGVVVEVNCHFLWRRMALATVRVCAGVSGAGVRVWI